MLFVGDEAAARGATLVVPAIGVGNVGQLALDLMIATAAAPRVGRFDDARLLPCVGAFAYPHAPGPALSLEAFRAPGGGGNGSAPLLLLQLRAPAAPGTQRAFAQALAAWAKEAGVARVVVLGSLDAATRVDAQLAGPQLRTWAAPGGAGGLAAACAGAGLAPLEEEWAQGGKPLELRLLPPWPLLCACREAGLPAAAVLAFATEGDNAPDAYALAAAAAPVVELQLGGGGEAAAAAWVQPPAWAHLDGQRDRGFY